MTQGPLHDLSTRFAALLPTARLRAELPALRERYRSGEPYPHLAIDGLFDPAVLDQILIEFPPRANRDWIVWDTIHEKKSTSRGIRRLAPFTQLFFLLLYSSEFVELLEEITGERDLVPDATFFGAGLQESFRGGWLDLHSDYTGHPRLPLTRRLNLLVYLNHGWLPQWGGDVELWNRERTRSARYAPLFNRTVVFPTTPRTVHGQPGKVLCPESHSRKLASVYYWSASPAAGDPPTPLRWYANAADDEWAARLDQLAATVAQTVPDGKRLILVDDGLLAGESFAARQVQPFLERDGRWFGAPPDDATAIAELERMRAEGTGWIVFAWPAFWWFDHYRGLARYLDDRAHKVAATPAAVVFALAG